MAVKKWMEIKLNHHYLGEVQQFIYSPNANRSYCTGNRLDSGRVLENFCVGADEVCSVIKATIDANS
ncbi:hypothetical protein [Paenibacillus glucanolyticus]|uniref:hypothetical protein n=1 Tax=Paenibacillus glucanolyticus TaxID=59843 RepID=UPI0034CF6BB9